MDELNERIELPPPSQQELADSVAAVNAAYADMLAGDTGRPAREALREECSRLGLVIDD